MEIKLRHKYVTYNGDTDLGRKASNQYGMGRKGNGNGKRPARFLRAPSITVKHVARPRHMVVDAATGHRVMVDGDGK